jgi:hypothetical protein
MNERVCFSYADNLANNKSPVNLKVDARFENRNGSEWPTIANVEQRKSRCAVVALS